MLKVIFSIFRFFFCILRFQIPPPLELEFLTLGEVENEPISKKSGVFL